MIRADISIYLLSVVGVNDLTISSYILQFSLLNCYFIFLFYFHEWVSLEWVKDRDTE